MTIARFPSRRAPAMLLSGLFVAASVFGQAPAISIQPEGQSVISGSTVTLSVTATGSAPLSYRWRLFGTNVPEATNSTLVLNNMQFPAGGLYSVIITNSFGSVTSAPALLSVDEHLTFRIVELQTNGSIALEHGAVTGDDRGGLVVSPEFVFVTGDNTTARFSAANLTGGASIGRTWDSLCSNLRNERIYVLANGTNVVGSGGGSVNGLLELDSASGLPNGTRINFSTNIIFGGFGVGIFSGYDRVVLWDGFNTYHVALPSGLVTSLGVVPNFGHNFSESWAFWGLVEYHANKLNFIYVENFQRIVRRPVSNPSTSEPLALFSSLSDMASIGFSVSRSRWYFHHEGTSQFRSGDETLGSAKALFTTNSGFPAIFQEVRTQTNYPGDTVTFSAIVSGTEPLTYQWRLNGTNIARATNSILVLGNVQPTATGNYTLLASNSAGSALSGNTFLFVVGAPQIVVQPQPASVLPGTNVSFSTAVLAAPPVFFQWRHNGTNIPNATNSIYDIPFATSVDVGTYNVVVTNRFGSATSSPAALSLIIESAYSFKVLSLSNNAVIAEHLALTGNDAGGIAVSSNRVFVTGDGNTFTGATATFSAADLTGGTTLPAPYFALVTDLRTERIYSLGDRTNLFRSTPSTTITTLIEINGTTGVRTTNIINLSLPISVGPGSDVGLFSGYGQIVIHTGFRVFSISVPSGIVADLGEMFMPFHQQSETWAFWGIAENFGNAVHLVYVQNTASIVRTRVPDGRTTSVANFVYLADMASIGASVSRGRWYFHHQGVSEFGGTNETVGFASARYSVIATPIIDHFTWEPLPGGQFSGVPFPVTISARTIDDAVLSNFNGVVSLAGFTTLNDESVVIAPTTSGNFSNGVWTGQIVVPQPTLGMYLRAADVAGRFGLSTAFTVVTTNDLALQVVPSTNAATLYAALTYHLSINNTGPDASSAVFLTNILAADVNLVSATPTQGSCSVNDSTVVCDIGTMSSGTSVGIDITIVPGGVGTLTNITRVERAAPESHRENNIVTNVIPVSLPAITVSDAAIAEGNSAATRGTNVFTVQLNTTSAVPITVQFATSVGTATNVVDYVNRSGTLTFAPGMTTTNVRVTIVTDLSYEQDEFFFLNFSNAANAFLIRTQAVGTILNDDPPPTLIVTNTTVTEGNSGTLSATITVQLSNPAAVPISLSYATSNGTAVAGADYTPRSGVLTFTSGTTNLTFPVTITGDTAGESNEFFYINFFNGVNIGVNTQILVVIMNNDSPSVDHFVISNIAPTQYVNAPFYPTIVAQDFNNSTVTNFNGQVSFALGSSEVGIGLGTTTWNWPLSVFYEDARCQTIYLAGEIGGVRRLTSLSLNVSQLPSKPMANWVIRLKHTPLSSYAGAAWENTGWTVVHQSVLTVTQTNWITFNFSAPFDYNGVDNLMVDFSFDDTSYNFPDGFVVATDRGTPRSAYARCDSCNGDPKLWSTFPSPNTSPLVPDVRFGGIGGAAITPTSSSAFTNGVWSGGIRALGPAEETPLIVIDTNQHFGVSIPITVVATDDLSVRVVPSANPAPVRESLVYSITVSNSGPTASSGVFLTNLLPVNAAYVSSATDRGTIAQSSGRVIADLGTLAGGESALVTIAVRPNTTVILTNVAIVRRNEAESYLLNNRQTNVVTVVPVNLSVTDIFLREGQSGTTNAVFTVALGPISTQTVSVAWLTRSHDLFGQPATPGVDFQTNSGVLVFPPGTTNRTIAVPIFGDVISEGDELFELVLSNPTNASILQSNALGFIINDDPLPMVSVSDVAVAEGREGETEVTVALTLSQASGHPVSVNFQTFDGTASGLTDYVPTNAIVTFEPGQTTAAITVNVLGDVLLEPDETFLLLLLGADYATIAVAEAKVTILNDEVGTGILDGFEISLIPSPQTTVRPFSVSITARDGVNALLPFNGTVSLEARSGTNVLTLAPSTVTLVEGVWSGQLSLSAPYTNVTVMVTDGAGHSGQSNPFDINVADLRITASTPPEALIEFPFNYVLSVSNAAINSATAVSVTNIFSSEVLFVDATVPDGACAFTDGIVSCNLGTLTNGQTATITLVLSPLRGGPLTNIAAVAAFESDPVPANNVRTNVLEITGDADADGLPDSWETQVGLSPSNPNDAQQDADGDRHTNLQEYVAGTDPMNPASVLKVTAEVNGATAQISFTTVAGRRYQVQSAPAPAGPWTILGNELIGEGDVAVIFDPSPPLQMQRFYRVYVVR